MAKETYEEANRRLKAALARLAQPISKQSSDRDRRLEERLERVEKRMDERINALTALILQLALK